MNWANVPQLTNGKALDPPPPTPARRSRSCTNFTPQKWMYEGKSRWYEYEDEMQKKLTAYKNKQNNYFDVTINGTVYSIDLIQKIQSQKSDPNKRRRIAFGLPHVINAQHLQQPPPPPPNLQSNSSAHQSRNTNSNHGLPKPLQPPPSTLTTASSAKTLPARLQPQQSPRENRKESSSEEELSSEEEEEEDEVAGAKVKEAIPAKAKTPSSEEQKGNGAACSFWDREFATVVISGKHLILAAVFIVSVLVAMQAVSFFPDLFELFFELFHQEEKEEVRPNERLKKYAKYDKHYY